MQLNWKQTFGFAVSALLVMASFSIAHDAPMPNDDGAIVLKNATLHTMAGRGTFVGDVLVLDGVITAIGEQIDVPEGATVYDLKGFHVVPGLIESRGKLWMTSGANSESNAKAELNVVDAIDPWSEDWRELAAQGITAVYVQPNSNSNLGGYGAVLRVGGHGGVDDIVLKKEVAIQAALGVKGTTSKDRLTQFKALEKLLDGAKEKKKDKSDDKEKKAKADKDTKSDDSSEATKKRGDRKGKRKKPVTDDAKKKKADSKDDEKKPKKKTAKKEEEKDPTKIALRRVLSKEIPLRIEVHHADTLKRVLGLAKKYKIRVVLDGLSQVGRYADEFADANIPFVAGPFVEQGNTPNYRKNGNLNWVSDHQESNRLWALSGFPATARGSQWLRVQASAAIRSGVDPEVALAAVTSNAARMLGVGDLVGTLEVGKQADIAVFAGDPLDPSTSTRLVLSHGGVIFENQTVTMDGDADDPSVGEPVALPNELPASYAVKSTRFLIGGEFVAATMVVTDGEISFVGGDVEIKTGRVFDLGDTVVTPGLVVASSSLGQSGAINDEMESDSSHLRSVDAVDPTTKESKKMMAGGFIHVGVSPGEINSSAGVAGHVRLGSADYVARSAIANQFVLSGSARKNDRYPSSLNGQIQLINGLFAGQSPPESVYVTSAIRRSIQHEKLANIQAVVGGDRIAIFVAQSDLEMRSAIAMAKKQNIGSPVLLSSGRVGDMAEKLAEQKFSLIVVPTSDSAYGSVVQQVLTAHRAGIPLAFAGEDAGEIRIMAALLVGAGVSREAVLNGLTESGGAIVGMKQIGLIKGAAADFVVWSGSPLNLASKPINIVVDGQPVTQK